MKKTICIVVFFIFFIVGIYSQDKVSGISISEYASPYAIKKNGITWHFNDPVVYGKFVNGDYWVQGPVTITSIDPAPGDVEALGSIRYGNGSMINPITDRGQAFDEGADGWNSSQKITFPVTLSAGDSIVSTISVSDEYLRSDGDTTCVDGGTPSLAHCRLWKAAVLTCVDSPVENTYFRPTFMGTDKKLYNSSNLNIEALPVLSSIGSTPDKADIREIINQIKNPWLTFNPDWTSRSIHPAQNMPNYHREVVSLLSTISNLLLLEQNIYTRELLIYTIQNGIDWYHMCILGNGDSAFIEWPVLFAGLMLNDEDMLNTFLEDRCKTLSRTQDKCYYWDNHNSTIESSYISEGQTWTGYNKSPIPFWRQSSSTGNQEHEHLNPLEEWDLVSDGGGYKREAYRIINSRAWLGVGFSAIALGLQTNWNNDAYFDYLDRWMLESNTLIGSLLNKSVSSYQQGNNSFVTDMWNRYRDSY